MRNNKKLFVFSLLFLIIAILFLVTAFIKETFESVNLDQIIFHFFIPLEDETGNFFSYGFKYVVKGVLLLTFFFTLVIFVLRKLNIEFIIRVFKKVKVINLNNIIDKTMYPFLVLAFALFLYNTNKTFDVINYIKSYNDYSELYENYYVDPTDVELDFPDKKKNLIYIMVESLETTDLSLENGGYREKGIIPELEKIALRNLNFSHNDKIGGFYQLAGTSYTAGAIVGLTAGVPLSGGIGKNKFNLYQKILPNAYSLGEVLKREGYNNYFMMGSDKSFAGRDKYLESHGNYKIFDFISAKEEEYIPVDYNINWWGFEDKKLYDYAKDKLIELSKKEEPFNFNLLTADTHPIDGYLDETCKIESELTKFENVFACASSMLDDFIEWVKKQKFYNNTTIVIVGDHLNMVKDGIHDNIPGNYYRTVYNAFINSINTDCNNNRVFNTLDMYPTVLAALGVKIEGHRLGLGTNLFSCEETLSEELGVDYFRTEVRKKSHYYNNCLFFDRC